MTIGTFEYAFFGFIIGWLASTMWHLAVDYYMEWKEDGREEL